MGRYAIAIDERASVKVVPASLRWTLPVITMVVAATAIPVEWRSSSYLTSALSLDFTDIPDIIENVIGFVPVGFVLGRLGFARAVGAATLLSTAAELSQIMMAHRSPSIVDVATNAFGAMLGVVVRSRWKTREDLKISRPGAIVAAALAVTIVVGLWMASGSPINERGATSPGVLEAYWKLDEQTGRVAADASGHGLDGRFSHAPKHVTGAVHEAVELDGRTDFVNFDHPSAFRVAGSMTISAWIKSSRYPVDDAAIVSTHAVHDDAATGYQLDTTIDRGPRTVGFKIGNECGELMARYGATPLALDVWYYVAGVYDAQAQTLDVYVNGKIDNGFLLGHVTGLQHPSRTPLYVGRRADQKSYEFAGAIGDVRLYSRALTQAEILADMHGTAIESQPGPPGTHPAIGSDDVARDRFASCRMRSDDEDARIPGAAAALGVLVAVACVGFWPSAGGLLGVAASVIAGLLLLLVTPATLPAMNLWLIPLTTLAGGASVAVSVRRGA
jgi:VanZ family protein